jgi:hypothetical protein
MYKYTYRRTERKTYRNTQTNRDRQTDRQTVQKCRKADKQIAKCTDILYIYLRYKQTNRQTEQIKTVIQTDQPDR